MSEIPLQVWYYIDTNLQMYHLVYIMYCEITFLTHLPNLS